MAVGFIGLGIMGGGMAANLLQAGHPLVVHNRTRSKADQLVTDGALWADTPAEVGRRSSVLFTMLARPEAVLETALGTEGFLGALPAGALWVDSSTVNPSFSRRMAAEAKEHGVRLLDAPVTGSKAAARAGELVFMVGGDPADVEECRPYLDVMGKRMVHVGAQGMGASLKIVFNLLVGQAMLSFSEAIALGSSLGLSRDAMHDFLIGALPVAPLIAFKRPKIESGNYEADFPLQLMWKDLHLAALTAYEQGVPLPVANVTKEIYAAAVRSGLADQDVAAIYRFVNSDDPRHGAENPGQGEVNVGER
jgi:3-hydroxyisobutyrate dehydrogenase/glyoxylate/succinic semialdehyde reductase